MLEHEVESVGGERRILGRLRIDEQLQVPAPHLADAALPGHFSDENLKPRKAAFFCHSIQPNVCGSEGKLWPSHVAAAGPLSRSRVSFAARLGKCRINSTIPTTSPATDRIAWYSLASRRRQARRVRTAAAFPRCSNGESLALRRSASAGFVLISIPGGLNKRARNRSVSGSLGCSDPISFSPGNYGRRGNGHFC
jgi:hypothetical protein